jgi:hypothetical protein
MSAQPGDRERIGVIGLAATATTQRADPSRQPGGQVEDRLAFGDQPLRQPGTHPAGTLDRPHAVTVNASERLHRPVAGPVVGEPLLGQHRTRSRPSITTSVLLALCGSTPITTLLIDTPSNSKDDREGRATSGEAHPS